MVPMTTNLDEEGPILDATPSIVPQFIPSIMEFGPWTFPILEEEEASVKGSMTSRLLAEERDMGGETSGSGGQPTLSTMGQCKVICRWGVTLRTTKNVPYGQGSKTKKEADDGSNGGIFMVVKRVLDHY